MKRLSSIVMLLFIFSAIPVWADDAPPDKLKLRDSKGSTEDGPGLKDTLEWIKSKINSLKVNTKDISVYKKGTTNKSKNYFSYNLLYDDCNIVLEIKEKYEPDIDSLYSMPSGYIFEFDLRDIADVIETKPKEVPVDFHDSDGLFGDTYIKYHAYSYSDYCTVDSKYRIKFTYTDGKGVKNNKKDIASFQIITPDTELAERLGTAMSHAIKLCKQKPKQKKAGDELF